MTMMKLPLIKTLDTKTNTPQFWQVHAKNWTSYTAEKLLTHGKTADTRKLDDAIASARKWAMSDLYFVPLSITEADQPVESRLQYRGYENDEHPFTIRGKVMPEIEASVYSAHELPKRVCVSFNTPLYLSGVTDKQKEWFFDRFGEQIQKACTQALLKKVQRVYISNIVTSAKADVQRLKDQLKEIAAYRPPLDLFSGGRGRDRRNQKLVVQYI